MSTVSSAGLVSVIIPSWNRAEMLQEALRSVQRQSWPKVQIIVVDDGSTDDTAARLAGEAGVLYIFQEHRGQAAARNLGLSRAQGEYIATLDSDDLWRRTFLERSVEVLEGLQADLVFSNWTHQRLDGCLELSSWELSGRWKSYAGASAGDWHSVDARQARRLFLEACPCPSSGLLFRREALVGRWNEEMHLYDDWCLQLDCVIRRPSRIAFTMRPLWIKRASAQSMTEGPDLRDKAAALMTLDADRMAQRFQGQLSRQEMRLLGRNKHGVNLSLARRLLLRPDHYREGLRLLAGTFRRDPLYSLHLAQMFLGWRLRRWLASAACSVRDQALPD